MKTEFVQRSITWPNLGRCSLEQQKIHPWYKGQLPAKFKGPCPEYRGARPQKNGYKDFFNMAKHVFS